MRASLGAANRLQLLQVRLGAGGCAELDHRFALDRDRIRIIRFQLERLASHSDRFAEQMLLFGDAGNVDEGTAIAWIDRKGGLEHVLGLLELTSGRQAFA